MDEVMEMMEEKVVRDIIKLIHNYFIDMLDDISNECTDEEFSDALGDILIINAHLCRYIKEHYGLDQDLNRT